MAKQTLAGAVGKALGNPAGPKSFDLDAYKQTRNLDQNTRFKPQEYLHISPALCKILSIPGIPQGHLTMIRGHSNTGKSTILTETAIACQKQGVLPIFIMTEMKWSWERAIKMGFEAEPMVDEVTGEISGYKGFFLYVDAMSLNTIEDVASFISDRLVEQRQGKLPFSLCFLWDSVGTIPCLQSIESKKNNAEWNAGAMAIQFGQFINQQFGKSRKEGNPYTNTLVFINHIRLEKPAMPGAQPTMANLGGRVMYRDASLVITMGGLNSASITRLKATRKGIEIEFGFEVKVHIPKNHITGQNTQGKIVNTEHGLIDASKESIDVYKKQYGSEWLNELGGDDFEIIQEDETGKRVIED